MAIFLIHSHYLLLCHIHFPALFIIPVPINYTYSSAILCELPFCVAVYVIIIVPNFYTNNEVIGLAPPLTVYS